MAPRGRARKRDKRMDAAIETMKTEYGISDAELVRKIAKELLNEYGGGDDAWYFVEQYTYLELLEAIVRYREENPQEKDVGGDQSVEGDFSQGNSFRCVTAEHHAPRDVAAPSTAVAGPALLEVEAKGLEKDNRDDADHLPSTEWDGKGWKDIGLDQSSSKREMHSPALLVPTTPVTITADNAQSRRRQPCYGWIESDEDDTDEFIELEPIMQVSATTTESGCNRCRRRPTATTTESGCSRCRRRSTATTTESGCNRCGRRSRWDLRPDDP